MPFAENLGTGGGSLDAQYGSSPTANTNAPLLLDPRTSGNFVYTPGTAGNYVAVPHSPSLNILGTEGTPRLVLPGVGAQFAQTPNTAATNITGDLELVARIEPRSWAAGPSRQMILGNYAAPGSGYQLELLPGGLLRFFSVTAGADIVTSSALGYVSTSGPKWVKVTRAVAPGTTTFFKSDDGITWTTVSTHTVAAGQPPSVSVGPLIVGGWTPDGVSNFEGDIYRAIVRNGINGTVVFDADFTQQALGSRGFIESTGKLVSLVGNAAQIVDGTTYGTMPSTSVAAGWTVPDSAALDVSDLEITARLSLNDWSAATNQNIVSKWDNGTTSQSYLWFIATNGRPTVNYKIGGVIQPGQDSGAAYPFTDGQTYWVRVRRIAATGVWRFYWAADSETEPTVWTNVGGDRAGTAGALDNSTALTTIGAFNNTATGYISQGRFYRAIIRNANTGGTKVLDADFTRQLQFASTFTEGSSQLATVTTVGAARIERDRDLDLRVKVALDDWTPSTNVALAAKMAAQKSYILMLLNTGGLYFGWSADGTNEIGAQSAPLGVTDGAAKWVRVTLDVKNGANGHTVSFFTSDDGTAWTPAPAVVTLPGATSIFPSTVAVEVATYGIGTLSPATGKFFNAEIRNGIDGPAVLDIDFTDAITTGAETYLPDTVTEVIPEAEQYLPNLGWGGTALNARFGSAVGADTNDPLLLTHTGTNYLYLPGSLGNWASSPVAAALNPSGATSVRMEVDVALDDWTPAISNTVLHGSGDFCNFTVLTDGRLYAWWYDAATTFRNGVSTIAVPFRDGERWRIAVQIESTGSSTFFVSPDGVTWSQLGAPVPHLGTGFRNTGIGVNIGNYGNFVEFSTGKFYRATIKYSGTVVFDANFTTGITSGAQTTFTESSTNAATVTINRSTSGRKSVAVVQDVLLFGTDDYLEVPDSDLLDFGANASFTVMAVTRQWPTLSSFAAVVAKMSGAGGTGYRMVDISTPESYVAIGDGVGFADRIIAMPAGALSVRGMIVDRGAQTIATSLGATVSATASTSTIGSTANALALRIGSYPSGPAGPVANEFRGSAIWRRALTAAEVALVNTHYTTGPTAASTALMQQAVFWIDAGTRSVAQINRSTSGRKSVACARCTWLLGTDDYFEVPASNLFDFAQGQDYTLLVLHRGWWEQGTNDTLLATSSSTTASAAGWAMSNSSGDPWQAGGRHGDGSNGVTAVAPRRDVGALTGTFLVRDCDNDTLTAFTGSTSGTPVTDTTTGTIGNTNVMRLGRLSTTGAEYLDAEVVAAVVWRRKLTTAERNAVLAYYGV